jgi:glycosyltransferase 2 family protein
VDVAASPKSPGFLRKNAPKFLISLLITGSLLYALHKQDFKFLPPIAAFAQVRWWVVPIYVLSLAVMSYFRATRWRYLLRSFADVPAKKILAVSWIGFAAILILPLRIGEFVRPYMVREEGKISMSAATGTIVAERVVDGLFVSIVLAGALLVLPTIQPLPVHVVSFQDLPISRVLGLGYSVLALFVTAFITIAVFYFARDFAFRATLAVVGIVSKKLAHTLAGIADKLAQGMQFLGNPRDSLPFLGETALYWIINTLGMWLLAWGCGVVHADGTPIHISEAFALMGMLGATVLMPGPPGLLGLFQIGIYSGMSLYFPESVIVRQGSVFTFLLYLIQLLWSLSSAGYFLLDPKQRRALAQAGDTVGSAAPSIAPTAVS